MHHAGVNISNSTNKPTTLTRNESSILTTLLQASTHSMAAIKLVGYSKYVWLTAAHHFINVTYFYGETWQINGLKQDAYRVLITETDFNPSHETAVAFFPKCAKTRWRRLIFGDELLQQYSRQLTHTWVSSVWLVVFCWWPETVVQRFTWFTRQLRYAQASLATNYYRCWTSLAATRRKQTDKIDNNVGSARGVFQTKNVIREDESIQFSIPAVVALYC